jgi:hypothetical protein
MQIPPPSLPEATLGTAQAAEQNVTSEYLSLMFHFNHKVTDDDFAEIARTSNKLIEKQRIKAQRVTFEGKHAIHPHFKKVADAATLWRKLSKRTRQQQSADDSSPVEERKERQARKKV